MKKTSFFITFLVFFANISLLPNSCYAVRGKKASPGSVGILDKGININEEIKTFKERNNKGILYETEEASINNMLEEIEKSEGRKILIIEPTILTGCNNIKYKYKISNKELFEENFTL